MTTVITTLPIDMAHDEDSVEAGVAEFEQAFPGVKVDVVRRVSSAGGWPEVTLTGEPTFIETILRTAWDTGDAEENDLLVAFALGDKDAYSRPRA